MSIPCWKIHEICPPKTTGFSTWSSNISRADARFYVLYMSCPSPSFLSCLSLHCIYPLWCRDLGFLPLYIYIIFMHRVWQAVGVHSSSLSDPMDATFWLKWSWTKIASTFVQLGKGWPFPAPLIQGWPRVFAKGWPCMLRKLPGIDIPVATEARILHAAAFLEFKQHL